VASHQQALSSVGSISWLKLSINYYCWI